MGSRASTRRARRSAGSVLLVLAMTQGGCSTADRAASHPETAAAAARLMPDPARLAGAPPELRARLAANPIALFRFVNRAWTREVCAAFAGNLDALPTVRLHGDAHVEQYAVTAATRGLDDFDDSARGPAVVDIVRFLGSLELTARDRGWSASLPVIIDAFFEGYRRALEEQSYLPPTPAAATRLRATPVRSPDAFLAWADSLMQPLTPLENEQFDSVWAMFETNAARADPAFTPAFLRRKKSGWLRLGVGSALTRKVLVHVEGPSAASDDDVVLEAKEVTALGDRTCLRIPTGAEVFRVVEGLQQIGRIEHRLVVALPRVPDSLSGYKGWWVKTWERTYRELEIAGIASSEELGELAHDVGAQLGSTNLTDSPRSLADQKRLVEREAITRLEPRMRRVADDLTVALLDAWQRFHSGSG